jgi:hypothetical protein
LILNDLTASTSQLANSFIIIKNLHDWPVILGHYPLSENSYSKKLFNIAHRLREDNKPCGKRFH